MREAPLSPSACPPDPGGRACRCKIPHDAYFPLHQPEDCVTADQPARGVVFSGRLPFLLPSAETQCPIRKGCHGELHRLVVPDWWGQRIGRRTGKKGMDDFASTPQGFLKDRDDAVQDCRRELAHRW